MRVVVIEDEPIAADRVCEFIRRYDKSIEIVAKLESIEEVRSWFNANPQPDLIFSDIELLDGNVIETLDAGELQSPVIFATAYDAYLLKAFERNGIAYLLKPFKFEDFVSALRKFEKLRTNILAAQASFFSEIQQRYSEARFRKRLTVKSENGIRLIETRHISHFQIKNGLLFAFDLQGNKYLLNESLGKLEKILDPDKFFRLNRSEMVNLRFIEIVEPYFKNRLVIKMRNTKTKLTTSASRTPAFRHWLESS